MKRHLSSFIVIGLLFALSRTQVAAAQDSSLIWTYKYLVATAATERELAPIAEHIKESIELEDQGLFDVVAERLLTRFDDPAFPEKNKARLIRALGSWPDGRYDDVLRHVLAVTRQRKVQQAVRMALPYKSRKASDPYVRGSVDLHAIVNEVEAAALAAVPTTAQGSAFAEFKGETLEQLYAWAGRPHEMISSQTRASDGLIDIEVQRLAVYYRGIGRAVFGYKDLTASWNFQAIVADPLAFENVFAYRRRASELGMPDDSTLEMIQLVSGYTAAIKNSVQHRYRSANPSREYLDTAAEVLLRHHSQARDSATIDAHAWICRLLSDQGGDRYSDVLSRVAAETQDRKLRRHATRKPGKNTTSDVYVPGTLSLDVQRAKYPTIYPGSTFTSGQL